MSRPSSSSNRELSELLFGVLEGAAKVSLVLGCLAALTSIGLLVYTITLFNNPGNQSVAQALANVAVMRQVLLFGLIAAGVGATYLFWGSELLGALMLIVSGGIYFAPLYLPSLISGGGGGNAEVNAASYSALQNGGLGLGAISLGVLVVDIFIRVRERAKTGAKADQLRYGKGIKEEDDRPNVFMGKCWQLPFCRKFVRERCPIYHAKVACWRERVGCMCEEEVIRNAMDNKPVPKDTLMAAKYIPRNNKLTDAQKADRCRQCVIYNEHQKHKYKLALPVVLLAFVGGYVLLRTPMLEATGAVVDQFNRIFGMATLRDPSQFAVPMAFQEVLLLSLVIVLLTYALKLLEYLIFKIKV